MKKNGFLKKLLMGVAVSLLTISIVGFLTTLSKSLFGSDTEDCKHTSVTSGMVVKPSTCTEDGEYRFTCRDCGEYVYKSIPASHKLEVIEGTPATCTEDGMTDGITCTVCDEIVAQATIIPATGHKGELGETCETCGEKIVLIPEDATLTQVSVGEKVAGKTYRIVASSGNNFYLSNGDKTLLFWVNGSFNCCAYCYTAPNLPFIHVEGVDGNSGYVDVTFVEGVDFSHTCLEYPDGLNFVINSETTISEISNSLTIYRAEYCDVDAGNHVMTADEVDWTAGEGEYAGFEVKACVCGYVFETFDVTNETIWVIDLAEAGVESTAKFSVLAPLDVKYLDGTVKCDLMDVYYNGESIIDILESTDDDYLCPVSLFGNASGRQYLSYIFEGTDQAEHEVKVYYDLIEKK